MDFQIPTTWFGLVQYLTKYITKSEPRSEGAIDILDTSALVPTSNVTHKIKSFVLHEVCGNRDVGKEEAFRVILSLPGKHSNLAYH